MNLTNADMWFFEISFAIVAAILLESRARIKRIEEKIDKLIDRK